MSNAAGRVSSRQPVDETLPWHMRRGVATDTSVLVFLTVPLQKLAAALIVELARNRKGEPGSWFSLAAASQRL